MSFRPEDVAANREYFAARLRAVKQKTDVIHKVKDGLGHDFVLLDVRPRAAFRKAHIRGAVCAPLEELEDLAPQLPRDRELVTYCWSDY
ncbi:MAG TPA: rhodanese-like domain-containing protein [Anaeromyxobacteraceae bacterium]|nr:rhodanese-like domain-containing protein [Anaeromyxobacteraceae bacterium]